MENSNELIEVPVLDDVPEDDSSMDDNSDAEVDIDEVDEIEEIDMGVCTFVEHTDSVYCACINPIVPGLVITGGGDDTAYLWKYQITDDEADNQFIKQSTKLSGHKDTVSTVGFNYDGTLALTGSYDGTVRIWSAETGELKQVLEGPEDIEWAEWHSKGNAVLAGSKDGTAWMWLAHNGQCVHVFAGHSGGVTAGCFTRDGKTVCTAGEDGSVRVWAPKTGVCRHVFDGYHGHAAVVTALVGSEDGDLLLSGSADGTVKLFQISGKRVLRTFQHSQFDATAAVHSSLHPIEEKSSMDIDHDDDGDEGEEVAGAEGAMGVECVGFCKSAHAWVASGGLDKTLKIWDTDNGICRSVCQHGASVVSLAWHNSLPVITTACLDHIVRLWDARSGTIMTELVGHTDMVTSLVLAPVWPNFYAPIPVNDETNIESVPLASDVLISVSDDHSAKVFHINPRILMK